MKSEVTKTTTKTYSGSIKKKGQSYYVPKSGRVKRPSLFPFDRYVEAAVDIQRIFRGYFHRKKFSDFRTLRTVSYPH